MALPALAPLLLLFVVNGEKRLFVVDVTLFLFGDAAMCVSLNFFMTDGTLFRVSSAMSDDLRLMVPLPLELLLLLFVIFSGTFMCSFGRDFNDDDDDEEEEEEEDREDDEEEEEAGGEDES